jgi:hypothetical protein
MLGSVAAVTAIAHFFDSHQNQKPEQTVEASANSTAAANSRQ